MLKARINHHQGNVNRVQQNNNVYHPSLTEGLKELSPEADFNKWPLLTPKPD